MRRNDALSRADRVLVAALAILLVTASTALGSVLVYRAPQQPVPVVVTTPTQTAEDRVLAELAAEHRCLSEALYYEARGEGIAGQRAVAEVVFHRMNQGNYGNSICAVVYEGSSHRGCQFSFTCNGDLHRQREQSAWRDAERLAAEILTGEVRLRNATGGATHYHAESVLPYWAPTLQQTARIGHHIFYRATHTI
jgi:spore germination cell wall hydrolase CwlJ-like protein